MGFMQILILLFVISFLSIAAKGLHDQESTVQTYIVHVELPTDTPLSSASASPNNDDLENWYKSFLPTTTISSSSNEAPRMLYSYHNVFKGFAAKLSAEDVKEMEKKPGFLSASPQEMLSLHTTHTPSFLGLHPDMGFWKDSNYGNGVIIGVMDTGIRPDHPSFSDEGMPPPPAKWKGKCEFNSSACNNKLIGARNFNQEFSDSVLDEVGHGTHTASTAAGNFVQGANVLRNANGTAAGIAPLAHLAMYKVCIIVCQGVICIDICPESAILAAMDAAIDDGVDILSLSIGGSSKPFYTDSVALGAYTAMEKGILVSCSAGNGGPSNQSLENEAPWILTVGASTIDRKIVATALLGNKEEFDGESLYNPKHFLSTPFPLYYAGWNASDILSAYCFSSALNSSKVQGKIVVCDHGGGISGAQKGEHVKAAGGVGMIIINGQNEGYTTFADAHVLPATHLSYADGVKVLSYINSTELPMAAISFKGTIIGDDHAPVVASFSSRGPSMASPGILKPDIIGPGVNILAAWPQSVENNTNTKSTFNILSGTSMSCPHLSGVAALLKSAHPDWSPAAIKSAIMTTADLVNLAKNPIEDERLLPANIFAIGSGHVNPSRANNPGLIYDIVPKDYVPYLCGLNYTRRGLLYILQRRVNCAEESSIPEAQLNYPSFSIQFGSPIQRYTRTVTNVGEAKSVYTVKVVPPEGVEVIVKPKTLRFSEVKQKVTYEVVFSQLPTAANNTASQGSITWTSAKVSVRSPIATIIGEMPMF
ncbi:subtilisin-like protease SBT1.7 [Coffea eugenioides]|uniref:Serine protease n=1 Tax=Coffea arabica TaxID=13443 RepID=F1DGA6_COFAR|nr:subtilisin-like protease SBT1.7 [Coffea arabica]XP_027163769.1 subtilisin-like protease SBT1.7 [Coffea eugenioides]ADY38794.1 serine protease [Coffea arabica]